MDGLAVLGMHDAAEMFLLLACEVNEAKMPAGCRLPERVSWYGYWRYLEPLAPKHRNSMNRLNKARVNLKHQGLLPSAIDLEGHRVTCRNFFEDNTPILFGMSLDAVSLIDLVQNEKTRQFTREAMKLRDQGEYGDAVIQAAIAFFWLLDDYRKRRDSVIGRVLFDLEGNGAVSCGYDLPDDVSSAIDDLEFELDRVRDAFKMMALGLDCRRWAQFDAITPTILRGAPLQPRHTPSLPRRPPPERQDADFCIEFVIQSALRLQDQA